MTKVFQRQNYEEKLENSQAENDIIKTVSRGQRYCCSCQRHIPKPRRRWASSIIQVVSCHF